MSNPNSKKPASTNPNPPKTAEVKATPPKGPVGPATPASPAAPPKPAPLFRKIDWVTFAVTTLLVLLGYLYTIAPDMTLEDSGELAVASMYAGVPHPPGYPVWTVYTWVFTKILPFSNMAWRVGVSSAVAGALACGLIALMVSRGSSMMIEGISELKNIDRRIESAICVVAGFVAGMLFGFNGFMWSQAVIVEVYTLSVLSLAGVLVCMLRWIYAPHQHRYLYLAFFWFGICFNNHQSLLVIALGLELAVMAVQPRLARELFFWNVVCWAGGLFGRALGMIGTLNDNPALFLHYNLIGLGSFAAWVYLLYKTKIRLLEFLRNVALVLAVAYLGVLFLHMTSFVTTFYFNKDLQTLKTAQFVLFNLFGLACIGGLVYLIRETRGFGNEWVFSLICGVAWALGAAFYVYMPLASMSNPPLNWGYPRTVAGFFHAFTRGQYERIHPTFGQGGLFDEIGKYFGQMQMYIGGVLEEFNLVLVLIAILPLFFYKRMQKRERAWIVTLGATYLCLSFLLLDLLNPGSDRQSRDLNKVFFTASHLMIAMGIGYGFTVIAATLVTNFEKFSVWARFGSLAALVLAAVGVAVSYYNTENPLVHYTALFGLLLAIAAAAVIWLSSLQRKAVPVMALLAIFALTPIYSILIHWEENEQRGHLFGYWFGHDMFTPPFNSKTDGKPIYPEMDPHTVLFGGTDPGRFNPTYMIFCESFSPPKDKPRDPKFDRRDVYLITQNALADGTYLNYIRAHYNRSTQIDPPFFSELFRGPREIELNFFTNWIARAMVPFDRFFLDLGDRIEKTRRAGSSLFEEDHFVDLPGLTARLKPSSDQDPLSKYLFERFSKETQQLITAGGNEKGLRRGLAKDLNKQLETEYQQRKKLEDDLYLIDRTKPDEAEKKKAIEERIAEFRKGEYQLYSSNRFHNVKLSDHVQKFIDQNPASHTLIRLNRLLLEAAYPTQLAQSKGGVYPDREIHTPSNDDSQKAFSDYLADAQQRLKEGRLKPGEDVKIIENRVQVSGQVAVMAINGLLTKVIFEKNPGHEFYVEESFPLDWMYPYLTPYGIIMKINRNPVGELTEDMLRRDHEFWSQFSDRLVGNWITYDTSISNICEFVERVHLRRDYKRFEGDSKFIRDNDGQKAFSKLRSSIAGVYAWRIGEISRVIGTKPPAEQQQMALEQQRVLREAEFAFKQAYAYCPYSPEAVFRYINLLLGLQRVDEAYLIAKTSRKLDPYNPSMRDLVNQLEQMRQQRAASNVPNQPVVLNAETQKLLAAYQPPKTPLVR